MHGTETGAYANLSCLSSRPHADGDCTPDFDKVRPEKLTKTGIVLSVPIMVFYVERRQNIKRRAKYLLKSQSVGRYLHGNPTEGPCPNRCDSLQAPKERGFSNQSVKAGKFFRESSGPMKPFLSPFDATMRARTSEPILPLGRKQQDIVFSFLSIMQVKFQANCFFSVRSAYLGC